MPKVGINVQFYQYDYNNDSFVYVPSAKKYRFNCEQKLAEDLRLMKSCAIITKTGRVYNSPVTVNYETFNSDTFSQEIVDVYHFKTEFNLNKKMIEFANMHLTEFFPETMELKEKNRKKKMEVEEEMNKDVMFNFEFGKIKDNSVKISMNGLAFKDVTGSYVTYDAKTNKLTDVSSLVFNMDFLYMMPVAIKDVKVNDVLRHNNNYVVVTNIKENGDIEAVKPFEGEKVVVVPKNNIFGFNYITKVVNMVENMFPSFTEATEDNPFGNIGQMMLMSSMMEDKNGDNSMAKAMMMYVMMGNTTQDKMPALFMMMNM